MGSLGAVIDALRSTVGATVPTAHAGQRFAPLDLSAQGGVDLVAFSRVRAFEVVSVGEPTEGPWVVDGASAYLSHVVSLRVAYPAAGWPRERDRASARASDFGQIKAAMRTPANWSSAALDVEFLDSAVSPVYGDAGDSVGEVMELRYRVDWEV